MNECPIPEAALLDDSAVEMLRVWITEGDLHCSMKVGRYAEVMDITEESVWGTILADVARTLSKALQVGYACDPADTLAKIGDAFFEGLFTPLTEGSGGFVQHH
ncbi:hypothetical protein PIN31115_03102 [Pandoraea iniqua]|uniref:DUF5076 domain-containing protein n=1 Tax=Pandoraea iniqua TaxID=2508288 RepID=A0A5E4WAN0_9BURK|nr:DUF5076 domain-containing protein [Pandoraea iniqua]VVE20360.1 hypothetical protein PIN31115_03102 [Pandoraea iniqua]